MSLHCRDPYPCLPTKTWNNQSVTEVQGFPSRLGSKALSLVQFCLQGAGSSQWLHIKLISQSSLDHHLFILIHSFIQQIFIEHLLYFGASLVAQRVKRLPAMWETRVWSLGWEDLLEKEMATYSSTLAWKIPWTEEPGRLESMGLQRVGHDWATSQEKCKRQYSKSDKRFLKSDKWRSSHSFGPWR